MKNWPINCCWGKTTRAARAHCRTFKTSCCGTNILIKQPNCGMINIPHSHYRNQLALTCSGGRSPLLTRVSFQKPTHSPPSYCVLGVVTDKSPPHYLCSTNLANLTGLLFQVGSYCRLEVPEWANNDTSFFDHQGGGEEGGRLQWTVEADSGQLINGEGDTADSD